MYNSPRPSPPLKSGFRRRPPLCAAGRTAPSPMRNVLPLLLRFEAGFAGQKGLVIWPCLSERQLLQSTKAGLTAKELLFEGSVLGLVRCISRGSINGC